MNRLLLIDGMAVVYRAYYALNHNPRINSKGLNTSAILGFTTTLLDLLQKLNPSHVGVAFDLSAPTFRHEEYPQYKANREATPEDIHIAIPIIKDIITAFNIPLLCKEGYEADDVIGTISHKAELNGFDEVLMATPDKDFAQLVTSVVKMYKFGRMKTPDMILGIEEVLDKFHIKECRQVIDVLGLCGDAIDNIPGISGIGDKSAQKLISEFGSIEGILENVDKISNNHIRQLVENGKDAAILSKFLATIVVDAPIDFNPESLSRKEPNYARLSELFDYLEFRQLAKRVIPASYAKPEAVTIASPMPDSGQLDLFSSIEPSTANSVQDIVKETLQQENIASLNVPFAIKVDDVVVCYDYKHCRPDLLAQGVDENHIFDILLVHYVLDPESRHNLEFIVSQRLGIEFDSSKPDDTLAALYVVLNKELEETGLDKIYYEVELPLVKVLQSMEQEGVRIDVEALHSYSLQLTEEKAQIEHDIYELVGHSFNISSPKQLGEVLYEELKITDKPPLTSTKQYSTAEEVLLKLKNSHPVVNLILEYRSISKLIGTYLDSFPKLIDPKDGRLHTMYNQAVTATGRLSSSNPNLQNIPIRTERGRFIRKAFVPKNEHYELLAADYSQIELRLIADMAQDSNMINAFQLGLDIHAATAAKIYHIPIEEVSKEQRRNAKSVNFGIIYGISAFGLSEQLGCSRKEAQQLIDDYFEQFTSIKAYIEDQIQEARSNGYAHTVMGRRRYLPDINSRNGSLRNFSERNAVNMPIQGTSADMIKLAMVKIYHDLNDAHLQSKMILQVHDELVFDVYKPEKEKVCNIVEQGMLYAAHLLCKVPIEVGMGMGSDWLEAH